MKKWILVLIAACNMLPSTAQIDSDLANRLQFSLDSVCSIYRIKGATAAVLIPGQGIWEGTYGVSTTGNPVTKQMAFGMGSNTKTFVSALLIKMQTQGLLSLDDTIGKWIQGYPNINGSATIRQCINHTAGLGEYLSASINDSLLLKPSKIWALNEILLLVDTPRFAPCTSWSYSNSGYVIVGIIIEAVTGKPYAQVMREMLLEPARYNHTFFYGENNNTPVVNQWTMNLGGNRLTEMNTHPLNFIAQLFSLANTAGGMMSTAKENVQFWYDVTKGELLLPAERKELLTMQPIGSGSEYGLGIFRYNRMFNNRTFYSHGGTFIGFINENVVDTLSGVAISVMTNQDSITNSRLLASIIPPLHRHTLEFPAVGLSSNPAMLQADIYPNPATEKIYIRSANALHELEFKLFGTDGRVLMNGEFEHEWIDVAHLQNGIYLLQIQNTQNGAVMHKRVMIK
jgi:D-alanyl-D-alanine carboxypeptidase